MATSKSTSTRVQAVTEHLRVEIFQGKYPPGTQLRELALAKEWNVSQATVREALQRLQHAGLVTRKPNVASTVTRLTPKDVAERVHLRATLEVMAAEAAARRMGEAEFTELERRLNVLEAAVAGDRYYEAAQADLDFHRYVWQCSGNDTLCQLLELVTVPLFAFISILRSTGLHRLTDVVEAHAPLITALRSGDQSIVRDAFTSGAVTSYQAFSANGAETAIAAAFGLLAPRP